MNPSSTASSEPGRRAATRYLIAVAVGLALVLAAAEVLLRRCIVPIDDSRANRVALVYTADGADAVLGDSHLYRAFIGSDRFVNLARAGSSPHALEIVAREYFRHRAPGRVILEAAPQLFNFPMQKRGAQQHDEYFALNRVPLPFVPYVLEPGIARQLALLADPADLRHRRATANGRKKVSGPYVERVAATRRALSRDERLAEAAARIRSNEPVADVAGSDAFAAYRRTVERLVARGARVCLARTPVDDAYLELAATNAALQRAHAALRALADEQGVRYVDFRDLDLDLGPADFTNPDHLTTAAGMRYAEALEHACFD